MIDYIKGNIEELTPTEVILDNSGIGYRILISLQTYEGLNGKKDAKVYIHHYLREDEELYYGFASKDERELFRLLIGVSGIGASTARMMLSSLTSEEIRNAILAEDINKIKSIKGIGLKSAQRLILELKDKVVKGAGADNSVLFSTASNSTAEEATTALVMLGFTKANVNKAVAAVLKEHPNATLEEIIKLGLKRL
ncbi:MAG: Holliday junction branch migration protein RuvA [Bacteroidales bacterium]|nr:Holliday junction branch migration protein RuvA [Bacteroidales bacterium]